MLRQALDGHTGSCVDAVFYQRCAAQIQVAPADYICIVSQGVVHSLRLCLSQVSGAPLCQVLEEIWQWPVSS